MNGSDNLFNEILSMFIIMSKSNDMVFFWFKSFLDLSQFLIRNWVNFVQNSNDSNIVLFTQSSEITANTNFRISAIKYFQNNLTLLESRIKIRNVLFSQMILAFQKVNRFVIHSHKAELSWTQNLYWSFWLFGKTVPILIKHLLLKREQVRKYVVIWVF